MRRASLFLICLSLLNYFFLHSALGPLPMWLSIVFWAKSQPEFEMLSPFKGLNSFWAAYTWARLSVAQYWRGFSSHLWHLDSWGRRGSVRTFMSSVRQYSGTPSSGRHAVGLSLSPEEISCTLPRSLRGACEDIFPVPRYSRMPFGPMRALGCQECDTGRGHRSLTSSLLEFPLPPQLGPVPLG